MAKFIITEEEKNRILNLYDTKSSIHEQRWLSRLLGTTEDDILKVFSKEGVENFEKVFQKALSNPKTFVSKTGQNFLKSASGMEVPVSQIEKAINAVKTGKVSAQEVGNLLPRQLADGSDFRQVFLNSVKKNEGSAAAASAAVARTPIASWVTSKWFSTDTKGTIGRLFEKLGKVERIPFDPKKVRVTNTTNIYGRDILEVTLPTGEQVLAYKSTGTGAPHLKKQGEWQFINGFMPNPADPSDVKWFIKDEATIKLSQGANKYATDFANYLQQNGPNMLGR